MKILSIIGARPQFVKAAVFRKYCHENDVNEILLHTGQHYDTGMSTGIFEELGVKKPDFSYNLSARSHGGMTGELLAYIEEVLLSEKPDYVNVYGDTNSTLAGALAASKLHIPVIHIEAGLRSFNKTMPEEINRILTDHVSSYLFCPTHSAIKNLNMENITKGVFHVGDIMFDAVNAFRDNFRIPSGVNVSGSKPIAVMTIHRADTLNSRNRLLEVLEYCKQFCETHDVFFTVHPNTQNKISDFQLDTRPLKCIQPISYLEMQGLLKCAELVLTDSGGLQKEAYFHECNCITLRDETEWVETVCAGWNRLWKQKDVARIKKPIEDYGAGNTCSKIFDEISRA